MDKYLARYIRSAHTNTMGAERRFAWWINLTLYILAGAIGMAIGCEICLWIYG